MPDISMCVDGFCPKCSRCYRYMAEPNEHYQSYSVFTREEDKECDNFMTIYINKED